MKNDSIQVKTHNTKPLHPDVHKKDLLQQAKDKVEEIKRAMKILPIPSAQPN